MMFAGDIGSISIAYLMIYFLVQWYLAGHSWTIILFLLVYGTDVFLTMAQRIKNKENITQPHRSHLYQLLVNQASYPHVTIAMIYAIIQGILNFVLFIFPQSVPDSIFALGILGGSLVVYLIIKSRFQTKYLVK
jgi:UDP-N-acetylmuramyl pentapeptide phosphotransferase/UDP-N-acetylglucosamine-1-phosphate transferase